MGFVSDHSMNARQANRSIAANNRVTGFGGEPCDVHFGADSVAKVVLQKV
jgi:hypothetical protein